MEVITKKFNVYEFDELDKKVQDELIEKEIQEQHDFYCEVLLEEDMEEKAKELLKKYFGDKADFKNVYYSLSWCQGDGAMIEFDTYYYNKFVKVRHSGNYYHSMSFKIDDISTYDEYLTDTQTEQLEAKIIRMNGELETYGWKLVDYYITDDEAKDYLRDFKYFENGEVFE